MFRENGNKKATVAILIPDEMDLKGKAITTDKEGASNLTLGIYPKNPKALFQKDM